jgi:hypothetical protein
MDSKERFEKAVKNSSMNYDDALDLVKAGMDLIESTVYSTIATFIEADNIRNKRGGN